MLAITAFHAAATPFFAYVTYTNTFKVCPVKLLPSPSLDTCSIRNLSFKTTDTMIYDLKYDNFHSQLVALYENKRNAKPYVALCPVAQDGTAGVSTCTSITSLPSLPTAAIIKSIATRTYVDGSYLYVLAKNGQDNQIYACTLGEKKITACTAVTGITAVDEPDLEKISTSGEYAAVLLKGNALKKTQELQLFKMTNYHAWTRLKNKDEIANTQILSLTNQNDNVYTYTTNTSNKVYSFDAYLNTATSGFVKVEPQAVGNTAKPEDGLNMTSIATDDEGEILLIAVANENTINFLTWDTHDNSNTNTYEHSVDEINPSTITLMNPDDE